MKTFIGIQILIFVVSVWPWEARPFTEDAHTESQFESQGNNGTKQWWAWVELCHWLGSRMVTSVFPQHLDQTPHVQEGGRPGECLVPHRLWLSSAFCLGIEGPRELAFRSRIWSWQSLTDNRQSKQGSPTQLEPFSLFGKITGHRVLSMPSSRLIPSIPNPTSWLAKADLNNWECL